MLFRRALPLVVFAAALSLLAGAGGAQNNKTFSKNKANDAQTCVTLWRAIGQPKYISEAGRDTILVCHSRYFVSHNNTAKTPDWVIERLRKAQVSGKFKRPHQGFVPEERVPDHGNPRPGDYRGGVLVLGHMAPSEDFNISCPLMRETFSYANAVPQIGDRFNGSIWKRLEEEVRDATRARGTLYVITGPIPREGTSNSRSLAATDDDCRNPISLDGPSTKLVCKENNDTGAACTAGVTVPIGAFKIVYDPALKRAYAFALANKEHPKMKGKEVFKYLSEHRVTVATITRLTGIEFLTDVPARADIVNKCTADPLWEPQVKKINITRIDCPPVKKKK